MRIDFRKARSFFDNLNGRAVDHAGALVSHLGQTGGNTPTHA
jgi:hypothetical protein